MKVRTRWLLFLGLLALFFVVQPVSAAQTNSTENELRTTSGIEWDSIIIAASGVLATVLFAITIVAYKRSEKERLLYVSIAFLLFAVKSFLVASDIFITNRSGWVDPFANLLDFVVLLSFFVGVFKK
jgi:hypothetical protein